MRLCRLAQSCDKDDCQCVSLKHRMVYQPSAQLSRRQSSGQLEVPERHLKSGHPTEILTGPVCGRLQHFSLSLSCWAIQLWLTCPQKCLSPQSATAQHLAESFLELISHRQAMRAEHPPHCNKKCRSGPPLKPVASLLLIPDTCRRRQDMDILWSLNRGSLAYNMLAKECAKQT